MVLTDIQKKKYNALMAELGHMGRVVLAFSGGVDSSLLVYCTKEALGGDNVLAVTLVTPYLPKSEFVAAKTLTRQIGVLHQMVEVPIHNAIRNNPPDRCYLCKQLLFKKLKQIAEEHGYDTVIDGSNRDDLDDYRPGFKAIKELGIRSPMLDIGLTKQDIRDLSEALKLPTWNKPATGCLLTRIPHGTRIDRIELERIEKGETFLRDLGLSVVRIRSHGVLARIELPVNALAGCVEPQFRERIVTYLKKLGYIYVTVDLAGYQTGSLNEIQNNDDKTWTSSI